MELDLANATFIGLMTIGAVNVMTFFLPDMDSRVKFAASVAIAFALTFVPAELGNEILERAKLALGVAFGASGTYKLATRIGGFKQ